MHLCNKKDNYYYNKRENLKYLLKSIFSLGRGKERKKERKKSEQSASGCPMVVYRYPLEY